MKRRPTLRVPAALALVLILAAVAGCSSGRVRTAGGAELIGAELTVAAAASLKPAIAEIAADFEEETGADVTTVFGSSGLLSRQIENGAPFDVFLSASRSFLTQLQEDGFVRDSIPFADGQIVLTGKARSLRALKSDSIENIALANPETAPYGTAARAALRKAGIWADVKDKIVYGENIGQAFDFVQTGNADAGIVARSLTNAAGITAPLIDDGLYEPIEQWAGVVIGTKARPAAAAFMNYLTGAPAQKTLRSFGYAPRTSAKEVD